MNNPIIFCDLDGVLVDLLGQMSKDLNINISKLPDNEIYNIIHNYFENKSEKFLVKYWSELPQRKNCQTLWNAIKKYHPIILTATMANKHIAIGKQKWCMKNLDNINKSQIFPVEHSKDKQLYAAKNTILIDDLEKNIKQFKNAGGKAILFKNNKQTIEELNKILKNGGS